LAGISGGQKFDQTSGDSNLAQPKEEHPLNDFGFVPSIFTSSSRRISAPSKFCHQFDREIFVLFAKSEFEALGDGTGPGRLDIRDLHDTRDFSRAH